MRALSTDPKIVICLLLSALLVGPTFAQEHHIDCPDYHWWGGCAATSVGMVMGWHDRNTYHGSNYGNLVPGGVAEFSTHSGVGGIFGYRADQSARATWMIASQGHLDDFWGVDHYNGRPFDCVADFIGTNQYPMHNGRTNIWSNQFFEGIGDYFRYRGYSGARVQTHRIDQYGGDFTYADFKAEIDAGRPVLLTVTGEYDHMMVGYGYDYSGGINRIMLHDTWEPGRHKMWWGGAYHTIEVPLISPAETAYQKWVTTVVPDGSYLRAPKTVDFGPVLVGRSASRSVAAENAGGWYADGTTNYLTAEWRQPQSPQVWTRQDGPEYVVLAPGEQCEVTYHYAPTQRRDDSSTADIRCEFNTATVTLKGQGVAPEPEVTTTSAGLVRIGTAGQGVVRVRNVGDGNLAAMDDASLWDESCLRGAVEAIDAGPFSGPGGDILLADASGGGTPGELNCSYEFEPVDRSEYECIVHCDFDNGGDYLNQPHILQAVLTGTGVGPEFSSDWDPGAVFDFGELSEGESADAAMSVWNLTPDLNWYLTNLSIMDVVFTGPDAKLFAAPFWDPIGLPVLYKGQQYVLDLRFNGDGTPGEKRATMTLVTDQNGPYYTPGQTFSYDLRAVVIPEPATLVLLGAGTLAILRRRR